MSWAALALLFSCTESGTSSPVPPALAPPATVAPAREPFTAIRALPDGPVAFQPLTGDLAVGAGARIVLYRPDGAEEARWEQEWTVQDLRFTPDGALWVLGPSRLARLEAGAARCTAQLEGEALLLAVLPDGSARLSERRWMESGVWGQDLVVHPDCSVERAELVQQSPTAIATSGWVARAAKVEAGPTRMEGPRVELAGRPESGFEVFADSAEVNTVVALAVESDRLFVLGTDGAWELWDLEGPRRLAGGESKGAITVLPLDSGRVAVGRDVIALDTGAVTRAALPGPAVAVSTDGRRWVLGQPGSVRLWESAPGEP